MNCKSDFSTSLKRSIAPCWTWPRLLVFGAVEAVRALLAAASRPFLAFCLGANAFTMVRRGLCLRRGADLGHKKAGRLGATTAEHITGDRLGMDKARLRCAPPCEPNARHMVLDRGMPTAVRPRHPVARPSFYPFIITQTRGGDAHENCLDAQRQVAYPHQVKQCQHDKTTTDRHCSTFQPRLSDTTQCWGTRSQRMATILCCAMQAQAQGNPQQTTMRPHPSSEAVRQITRNRSSRRCTANKTRTAPARSEP